MAVLQFLSHTTRGRKVTRILPKIPAPPQYIYKEMKRETLHVAKNSYGIHFAAKSAKKTLAHSPQAL
jgi:hypothetical protein